MQLDKFETQVLSLFVPSIRQEETADTPTWRPLATIISAFGISAVLWASIIWLVSLLIGR